MKKLVCAALLVMAMPATAQQTTTHNGNCEVHRNDQLRCALRIPMVGNYTQTVMLMPRGDGRIGGQAQVWLSECGRPGSPGPVVYLTNGSTTHRLRENTITAVSATCPEIFIFNCQENGRAVPCQRGFANATMRVDQIQW